MKNENSTAPKRIAALVEKVKKGRKWTKYYGDVLVRIFREFIMREIPSEYTVSSPNAYIEGFPTEFDILVVRQVKPIKYTNAYRPEDVRVGMEIKARGVFGGRADLEKGLRKIKDNFDAVKKVYSHMDFIYLTYKEAASPKRETSIRYLEETIRILRPHEVFCLKDSRSDKLRDGEWERFTNYLNKLLQR